jgi:hypothetical protein
MRMIGLARQHQPDRGTANSVTAKTVSPSPEGANSFYLFLISKGLARCHGMVYILSVSLGPWRFYMLKRQGRRMPALMQER